MNEQTTNLVNEILTKAIKIAEKTGEFVIDQAPDVVQQLLTWKFTVSLIMFVWVLLFLVVSIIVWVKKVIPEKDEEVYLFSALINFSVGVLWCLPIPLSNQGILDWLQIWVAPKLYLLEYASRLIKQ